MAVEEQTVETQLDTVIEARGLTKQYGDTLAVDHLDLSIRRGEIFGLLGPNGAGKTTTILMLLGLTEPTDGTGRVLGIDPLRDPLAIKRRVSYLPDKVGFYPQMTGYENLNYTAALNGLDQKQIEGRLLELLDQMGLAAVAHQPVGTYSHGMRQRLGLADVLVKDPSVIILDEPTNGLDPEATEEFLGFFRRLSNNEGRTLLISSHLLQQMQSVCDRVGLFVNGRLEAIGPVSELGSQLLSGERFTIEAGVHPDSSTDQAASMIETIDGVQSVEHSHPYLIIEAEQDVRTTISQRLAAEGLTVSHLRLQGTGLNDIYLRYFRGDDDGSPSNVA